MLNIAPIIQLGGISIRMNVHFDDMLFFSVPLPEGFKSCLKFEAMLTYFHPLKSHFFCNFLLSRCCVKCPLHSLLPFSFNNYSKMDRTVRGDRTKVNLVCCKNTGNAYFAEYDSEVLYVTTVCS